MLCGCCLQVVTAFIVKQSILGSRGAIWCVVDLKYAENGISEREHDACLGPQFDSHSSQAALNHKRRSPILEHSFNTQNAHICLIVVKLCMRKAERKKLNKTDIFKDDFLDFEQTYWKSGSMFYNRLRSKKFV